MSIHSLPNKISSVSIYSCIPSLPNSISIRQQPVNREIEHNSIWSQHNANESDNGNEDIIKNTIQQKEDQEIEKIKKFYEDKFIMRFLRLIETFTSIATNKKEIRQMVFNVATSIIIFLIIKKLFF